jgi:hypothetical protein
MIRWDDLSGNSDHGVIKYRKVMDRNGLYATDTVQQSKCESLHHQSNSFLKLSFFCCSIVRLVPRCVKLKGIGQKWIQNAVKKRQK